MVSPVYKNDYDILLETNCTKEVLKFEPSCQQFLEGKIFIYSRFYTRFGTFMAI